MFWTFLALAMTVLMGGIIAYNGDLIGRKYGKRRVSLFGLRPKHTAILITSVTGVVISGITTFALFLLSPPVRHVILEGEEALRVRQSLQDQNRLLSLQNEREQQQNAALREQGTKERQQIAQLDARRRVLETRLSHTETKLHTAENTLVQAQQSLRVAETKTRFSEIRNRRLIGVNRQLVASNHKLSADNFLVQTKNTLLDGDNRKLAADVAVKKKSLVELDGQNQELGDQNTRLVRENTHLMQEQDSLIQGFKKVTNNTDSFYNGQIEEMKTRLASLTQENSRLTEENKTLTERAAQSNDRDALYKQCEKIRQGRVVIRSGDDMGRYVIPANATPTEVREALDTFAHQVSETALQKGAGIGTGVRAIRIADRTASRRDSSGMPLGATENGAERIENIVSRVAWSPRPVCVLAISLANSVEQEPALVDFEPLPNPIIYMKGRKVAARRLDGSRDTESVFSDVVGFLKELGDGARLRGMIPHIDPVTGEAQVGSLNAAQLASLVERIRIAGRSITLTATAAKDTHAADTLELNFKISAP